MSGRYGTNERAAAVADRTDLTAATAAAVDPAATAAPAAAVDPADPALPPADGRAPWWRLAAVLFNADVPSDEAEFDDGDRQGRGRRRHALRSGRGWTGWVWRHQPLPCAIGLALRLSTFAATLWWSAWLGFWLAGGSAPAAMGLSTPPWRAALVMLAAIALGGAAGLVQELVMRRAFFVTASGALAADTIGDDLPASTFDRLRTRDLLALPDHLTAAVDLVFTPLALLMGLAWLAVLFGGPTAGSGALAIGVALLVTGFVGAKSLGLAEPLVASGGRRLDLVSRWLDRRWFLTRWGRAERPLRDIARAADAECRLMTRDSLWRGLEGYLSGFGVIFAVTGAVAARWLFDASPNGMLAFAWTLLPMIDVALSQARVAAQCAQATRLLAGVREALPPAAGREGERPVASGVLAPDDPVDVTWDERWRLFDASLLTNLEPWRCLGPQALPHSAAAPWMDATASWARFEGAPHRRAPARAGCGGAPRDGSTSNAFDIDAPVVPFAISLLRHLRLADELWGVEADDWVRASGFELRDDGDALSAGQRVRVLFARAVLQAKSSDRPLDVAHSLSALDADALRRVREAPMLAGIEVNWGEENLALFAAVDAIDGARQSTKPESQAMACDSVRTAARTTASARSGAHADLPSWRRTSVARAAGSALRGFVPLAVLAAIGLLALSRMLAARPADASWRLLLDMASVAIPSLALVVAAGMLLERSMRRAALRAHAALLTTPDGERSDLLQRLGRDFEVVTGRLAWYVHDLGWIAATAALGLLSMLVAFGPVGGGFAAALALACALLWRALAPRVVSSRRLAVDGINRYLAVSANLRRLGGVERSARDELRRRYAARSVHVLWRTQAATIGSKGALSYHASLLGAVMLAAVCVAGAWLAAPREALVFVVAALLAVNRLSATLVQGLAGLTAQSLSASRLCAAEAVGIRVDAARRLHAESCFVLPASRNATADAGYAPVELPVGSMTLLAGPSGSGKTQFLRHHAEHAPQGEVLYFPRDTPGLLELAEGVDWRSEVERIVLRATRDAPACVFLDELTTLLPPMVAAGWLANLHLAMQACGGAIVVVDHRLKLDRVIRVDELFARVAATAS